MILMSDGLAAKEIQGAIVSQKNLPLAGMAEACDSGPKVPEF